MGLVKKKGATAVAAPKPTKAVESNTEAAIDRLKTAKPAAKKKFVLRDQDKVALGKTRCVQFQSALESPAIAGMQFETMEQYLELVRQAADAGVEYSFQD